MDHPWPLFRLFSVFPNKQYNVYNKSMWKISIKYMTLGFDPRPLKLESSPITTWPGLQPNLNKSLLLGLWDDSPLFSVLMIFFYFGPSVASTFCFFFTISQPIIAKKWPRDDVVGIRSGSSGWKASTKPQCTEQSLLDACYLPGSLTCTWLSTNPGIKIKSPASTICATSTPLSKIGNLKLRFTLWMPLCLLIVLTKGSFRWTAFSACGWVRQVDSFLRWETCCCSRMRKCS